MPSSATTQPAQFSFSAGDSDFGVLEFRGSEAISRPFLFEIDLLSSDLGIDFDRVLQSAASLTVDRGTTPASKFSGVLASFELRGAGQRHAVYRAVLVPRFWLLTLTLQSRIFQDKTIGDILQEVLKEHGFTSDDYTLRLTQTYPPREYVVQYQETDFAFISRWLEHEGIFYFFDDGRLIVADDGSAHKPVSGEATLPFRHESGLVSSGKESVSQLVCRQAVRPEKVILKDYNWRRPGMELKSQQTVKGEGTGTVVEYGAHFKDTGEGGRLARVRGQEIECRKRTFTGQSDCRGFRAGFQYQLTDHYRRDFNAKYLLVEVEHEGGQTGTNADGLVVSTGDGATGYRNTFVAIPADASFRPERVTAKPRLYGTMNAKVDAAGDGKYAEVDEQGRYKIVLPFDLSGKSDGKASRFMRMAQPYAGPDYGMHFPLHKGAEVLVTCIDGDPDRPIICGAVPNPDSASPVKDANQTSSVIRDHRGNEMVVEGTEGQEHIKLHSPNQKTTLVLGGAITAYTEGSQHVRVLGESRTHVTQDTHHIVEGNLAESVKGNHAHVVGQEQLVRANRVVIEAQDEICLQVGGSFISIRGHHIAIEGRIVDVNSGGSASGSSISSLTPQEPQKP